MQSELDQARQARHLLEKVRERLLRPTVEALDGSAADLSIAVECLQRLEANIPQGKRAASVPQALRLEIAGVQCELRRVQALVAGALRFHAGWGSLMSVADDGASNYTASGDTAAARSAAAGKVVLHG